VSSKLDKLRAMILHPGTPDSERRSALNQLERALAGQTDRAGRMRITRSVRIGRQRRVSTLDEVDRLDLYAGRRSYGEAIADFVRACRMGGKQPASIDFGFHANDEAVVALRFEEGGMPDAMALQAELRRNWPDARITLGTGPDTSRNTYIVYLGVDVESSPEAA